jgi:proteasome lid subunit RPN8/RPN11
MMPGLDVKFHTCISFAYNVQRAGEKEVALAFRLTEEQSKEIIQHALEEYPNEACGLLAGKNGRVEKVYRMTNVEHSPVTYRLDPEEQYRAFVEIEERGWELLAIYHSHIASPAYPSARDLELAFYPDSLYLIISLMDRARPVIRAFKIVNKAIEEKKVVITSGLDLEFKGE